jgi:F-type H+-transporting ATPase subunit delta
VLKGAIARRYAEAAFQLALEQQAMERWLSDVRTIAEYFGNRQLAFILGEPNIAETRKEQVVRDLLAGKLQHDALGLALLLVERDLVGIAPQVANEFERSYNNYLGQAHAQITTAVPLDDETRERVRRDLQEITGKRIILHENVDSKILGGAVARVGDTLIDGSVRRRLALLRQQIIRGGGSFGGSADGGGQHGGPGGAPDGTAPFVVAPTNETNGASGPNGANGSGRTPG